MVYHCSRLGAFLFWDLIRRVTVGCAKEGDVAGCEETDGYQSISIDCKRYKAHRLIWLYYHGYFPENDIDHINRDRSDNRIENLRVVSKSCNLRNSGNWPTNRSGVKGVGFNKADKVWRAHIGKGNTYYYLGRSKDFNEAVLLRYAAEQCLNWGKCDSMSPAHSYAIEKKLANR